MIPVANRWDLVAEELSEVLAGLWWGSFVVVHYDRVRLADSAPYVQAAPGPSGWYAEIESEQYLEAGSWPLDKAWLASWGWHAPDHQTGNWWRASIDADEIATCLLDGLRVARTCLLAELVSTEVGTFPAGPNGGERGSGTLPARLAA